MKKVLTLIGLSVFAVNAQLNIIGSNRFGAAGTHGSIYEFNVADEQLDLLYEPTAISASYPRDNDIVLGNDGLYYGVSANSGIGVLFSWNPLTNEYVTLYENESQLTVSQLDKVWSQPLAYDQANQVIFTNNRFEVSQFNITTGVGEIIYTFSNDYVTDHNIIYHNNRLWGTRFNFSTSNFEIYSYDLTNQTETMHYALDQSSPQGGFRAITLDGDFILGANRLGAFRFNTINDQYEQLFTCTVDDGRLFNEPKRVGNKIYLTSIEGGDNNRGVLLAYDVLTEDYEVLQHFDTYGPSNANIGGVGGYRIIEINGTLYFTTRIFGAEGSGTLLSYEISNETLTKAIDFDTTAVSGNFGALVFDVSENSIFALSNNGGAINFGSLFSYNLSSEALEVRLDLGVFEDGVAWFLPFQVMNQGTIYGIGRNRMSQILVYAFDMNTQEVNVLNNFEVTGFNDLRINEDRVVLARSVNGEIITYTFDLVSNQSEVYSFAHPEISTIQALEIVGDDIYFANETNGAEGFGFIGKHNKIDNNTEILYSFSELENEFYSVFLEYYDNALYFSSDNSTGSILHRFDFSTSSHAKIVELDHQNEPELGTYFGRFTIEDNQIFGSTFAGGDNDLGVIFRCDLSGDNYTILYDYQMTNLPNIAKPLFKKGGFLFGYNYEDNWNVEAIVAEVFMLEISTGNFEVLYALDYQNTGVPIGNDDTWGGFLFVYDNCDFEDYSVIQAENSLSLDLPNEASVEWFNCNDATTVMSSDLTFTPTESGEYKAFITFGTCEVETDCINVQLLGVQSTNNVSDIFMFPNPATTSITIAEIAQPSTVTITDLNGRVMYTSATNETSLVVALDNYASGVYLVNVVNEQFKATQKLVVR